MSLIGGDRPSLFRWKLEFSVQSSDVMQLGRRLKRSLCSWQVKNTGQIRRVRTTERCEVGRMSALRICTNPSFRQVLVHTAMGAVLGGLLALAVILINRHVFELITHSQSRHSSQCC